MKERESPRFDDGFCMGWVRGREQVILNSQISVLGNRSVNQIIWEDPGQLAQLVSASSRYAKVGGLMPLRAHTRISQ